MTNHKDPSCKPNWLGAIQDGNQLWGVLVSAMDSRTRC